MCIEKINFAVHARPKPGGQNGKSIDKIRKMEYNHFMQIAILILSILNFLLLCLIVAALAPIVKVVTTILGAINPPKAEENKTEGAPHV